MPDILYYMAETSKKENLTIGKIIFVLVYILIFPTGLLFISGNWLWLKGWIFNIWFIILCFGTIIYLYIKDPALLMERYKKPGEGGQKGWDVLAVYGIMIGFMAWIIIMPLDAKRYSWSPKFPLSITTLGFLLLLLASYFLFSALKDNTFASNLVRIQKDRKQKTVSTGVYGIVRHPMYLGGVFLFLGAPLFLGSVYALIIGILMTILLMARITGEEKLLSSELEDYEAYRSKVKFRLIPFVW